MVSSCCAVGCTKRKSTHKKLTFYRFPSKNRRNDQREAWIQKLKRADWPESEDQVDNARLCSSHFVTGKLD